MVAVETERVRDGTWPDGHDAMASGKVVIDVAAAGYKGQDPRKGGEVGVEDGSDPRGGVFETVVAVPVG